MPISFRKEVLEARSAGWLGSVELASPPRRWATIVAVSLVTLATLLLLVFGRYTKRQSVEGSLVPSTGLVTIVSTTAGTVNRAWVRQGDRVRANEHLVEIGNDTSTQAYGETMLSVSADLQKKKEALIAGLSVRNAMAEAQARNTDIAVALMRHQVEQLGSQVALAKQRAENQREQVDRFKPSVKSGLISRTQFVAQQDQLLADQSELHRLIGAMIDLQHQIEEKKENAREIPMDLQRFKQETSVQLAELSQLVTQNEAKRLSVITSPTAGRITAVLTKAGQGVAQGQTLVSILPDNATLEAQLLVPSRAIASVKVGSVVAIRYAAFPYQQYGVQFGEVDTVSRSALGPKEIEQVTGKSSDDPVYRVYVRLDRDGINPERLIPGMTLTADILMEKRTLLEWAIEPIRGLRSSVATKPGTPQA